MKIKALLLMALTVMSAYAAKDYTQWVDPMIGSGGHGHVFVGANVPFGFVQLGPSSVPQSWDWCSGYNASDSTVIGFPHTHLSGTGCGDLHDITLMPVVGTVNYDRGNEEDPKSGLWSYQDKKREHVEPGYYETFLTRYGVNVQLTATSRVGFHKYTFPEGADSCAVVIDLCNGGSWDRAMDTQIEQINEYMVKGYRFSKGWANNQKIYFVATFSEPIKSLEIIHKDRQYEGYGNASIVYGRVNLDAKKPVLVTVAVSPTSCDNAILNMGKELPGWDFEATKTAAKEAWNKELSKIDIDADDNTKKIFYTALYHTMIAPSEFCDVNGDYYGADNKMHKGAGFTNYTTFSCWDTYRSAHPLMTLIHPEKQRDIAETMMRICEEGWALPVWHLMGCETNCMVGNPGVCIFADMVTKGYVPLNERTWKVLDQSGKNPRRGQKWRMQYGYIPCDSMRESVAFDMEYCIADWATAQVAKKMGRTSDYNYYLNRSHSYRNFFDKTVQFMRGKKADGTFKEGFNPNSSDSNVNDMTEGNSWQYTFLVPHDLPGLVKLFGGKKPFLKKLDELFEADMRLDGKDVPPDISGLIGQYVHGNEPSHHIIYLYSMLGERDKAAPRLRQVMRDLYTTAPDGLSGNEDVGQMSAWYILSAMGIYQVEPAGGRYFFGSPIVNKATMKVRDGQFTINVHNNSAKHMFIDHITLNGKKYTKAWLDFADIAKGGTLDIYMR